MGFVEKSSVGRERVDRRKAAQTFGRLVVLGTRELPLAPSPQKTSNRLFLLRSPKKGFLWGHAQSKKCNSTSRDVLHCNGQEVPVTSTHLAPKSHLDLNTLLRRGEKARGRHLGQKG